MSAKIGGLLNLLNAHLIVLEKYIESLKVEEIEKTKREKLEKDIKLIKNFLEKKKEIINGIYEKRLDEKERILNALLREVDRNIENNELLNYLLEVFVIVMKSPVISKKELETLATFSIENLFKDDSILDNETIEI